MFSFHAICTYQYIYITYSLYIFYQYRQYKVKDISKGTFPNFRLCDNRGFEEEFALDAQEISFILDGNIPDRYQVYHIFLSKHKSFYILVLF